MYNKYHNEYVRKCLISLWVYHCFVWRGYILYLNCSNISCPFRSRINCFEHLHVIFLEKKKFDSKAISLEFPPHTKLNITRSFYSHHLICLNLKFIIQNKYFSKFIFPYLIFCLKVGTFFFAWFFSNWWRL